MKYFVIVEDFEGGGGIAGNRYGFDSLEEAKAYIKPLVGTFVIIKGDIVSKIYKGDAL